MADERNTRFLERANEFVQIAIEEMNDLTTDFSNTVWSGNEARAWGLAHLFEALDDVWEYLLDNIGRLADETDDPTASHTRVARSAPFLSFVELWQWNQEVYDDLAAQLDAALDG